MEAGVALQYIQRMAIVRCWGELDLAIAEPLGRVLGQLPGRGVAAVVVDMAGVTFTSCGVIGLFVAAALRCSKARVGFRLCNVSTAVERGIAFMECDDVLVCSPVIGDALEDALRAADSFPGDVAAPVGSCLWACSST